MAELLADLSKVPEPIREAVRDNGGGHYNHSYYWASMTPDSQKEPTTVGEFGKVKELITKQYGSFDAFKTAFKKAAMSVFGSGWTWLVREKEGNLKIITSANQDTPLKDGLTPILAFDVWEHAYYLKHQNKRGDYIDAWWNVVSWKQAEKFYQGERLFVNNNHTTNTNTKTENT